MVNGESKWAFRWSTANLKRNGTPTFNSFADTNNPMAIVTRFLISGLSFDESNEIINKSFKLNIMKISVTLGHTYLNMERKTCTLDTFFSFSDRPTDSRARIGVPGWKQERNPPYNGNILSMFRFLSITSLIITCHGMIRGLRRGLLSFPRANPLIGLTWDVGWWHWQRG